MSDSPNSIRAFAVPSDTTEQLVAPDPIYAAIEAHRRADEEYGRAELWKDNNPETIAKRDAAAAAADKAMRAMLAVTPTTLAGIAAVARYCLGSEHLTESEFWTEDTRTESRSVAWFLSQQAARIE